MNDVFISYRRHNGEAWASLIKTLLERRGVRCYLDKQKKRTIDFKKGIINNISQSNNLLLLLTEGIFDKNDDDFDWVKFEILQAVEKGITIIPVTFNGYDPKAVDWKVANKDVDFLETREALPFVDENIYLRDASIDAIISYLLDENKKPWKDSVRDNNNWYGDSISDEDRIWMYTNNEACKKIDMDAMQKIIAHPLFQNRTKINLFSLLTYDIDTFAKRINSSNKNEAGSDIVLSAYGLCHKSDLEHANKVFGHDHYRVFDNENNIDVAMNKILEAHNLDYFDIIEATLLLKDCKNPDRVIRKLINYLNPKGGALFIRDLDDDLVVAYPDDKHYISKLISLLSLDPGAGNRHFGKKIYNTFKKSGAEYIYMVDGCVSTANVKMKKRKEICDAYFSYLVPEFRLLAEQNPENEDYVDAYNWLEHHYDDVIGLFESDEFYFRAGFICGFGIYTEEE